MAIVHKVMYKSSQGMISSLLEKYVDLYVFIHSYVVKQIYIFLMGYDEYFLLFTFLMILFLYSIKFCIKIGSIQRVVAIFILKSRSNKHYKKG